jgi:ubiquinone/menaquinone biosynthesis C-methylase UbiE
VNATTGTNGSGSGGDGGAIAAAYDAWAASYDTDANRTRDLDAEVLRVTLRARRLGAALELGCGTGKNTAFLAAIAERVVAADFSPGMIAVARAKVHAPNVRFVRVDATAGWPLPAATFDLVTFDLVLEHVADLRHVAAEAARVLRPGGELFVCELHPFRQYEGKQAHFVRGDAVHTVPAFVHHVADFVAAGLGAGLQLVELREHWHTDDAGRPPRLLSLRFRAAPASP